MKEYKKLCVCEICKKSGQHSLHFAVTEGSASCEKKIKLRSGKSKPKFCEGENGWMNEIKEENDVINLSFQV